MFTFKKFNCEINLGSYEIAEKSSVPIAKLSPTLTSSINHRILSQPETDDTILLTRPEIHSAIFEFCHSSMFLYMVLWHITTCTDFISTLLSRCRTVYSSQRNFSCCPFIITRSLLSLIPGNQFSVLSLFNYSF